MSLPPSPVTPSPGASLSPSNGEGVVASQLGSQAVRPPPSDALRKKRERDKVSQRRKRQREREYTVSLEEKIRRLEDELAKSSSPTASNHDPWAARPPGPCYSCCGSHHHCDIQDDETQICTKQTVALGEDGPTSTDSGVTLASMSQASGFRRYSVLLDGAIEDIDDVSGQDSLSILSMESPRTKSSHSTSSFESVPFDVFEKVLGVPEWSRIPLHSWSLENKERSWVRGDKLLPFIQTMRADPNSESMCPPQPAVIDILYGGSSQNVLANLISTEVAKEALLPPEKFAISWALYLYCRWIIWPSEKTFQYLPKHFRPTARQLAVPHPWCIDLLQHPQLRDRLITNANEYDVDEVVGLFLITLRLRGGFNNNNFITRENGGDLQIDPKFYKQFMTREGWGILDRFWVQYPELVKGMDPIWRLREEHLLPL
ncbi:unnamed protein product [Clonostachys chloroleuca]|uniref:BZIP domain-containing protein n=1 Tax=Clonostachys chloroleuca TaxID=1926264 RepID=A0AA35QBB1_9HYPO|nr:unnamed protein product [Clonostachys chloroleuca]